MSLAANPFPGFTGAAGHLSARPRAAGAGAPEPLEDGLPASARCAGLRGRTARSAVAARRRGGPDLVRGALHGRAPRRVSATSPPTRSATAARRTPTSSSSPTCIRMRARSRARSPSEEPAGRRRAEQPRREPARTPRRRRARRRARGRLGSSRPGCSGGRRCRRRCTCRTSTRRRPSRRRSSAGPTSFDHGRAAPLARAASLVELAVFALYAWRGAGFARESAAGPIGTGMLLGHARLRAAVARRGAVRSRSSGGTGGTGSASRATGRRSPAAGSRSGRRSCSSASRSRS